MKWPFFFVEHARTHLRLRGCADFFVGASPFPDPALHITCVARSATAKKKQLPLEKPAQHVFRLKVEDLRDRRCYRIIVLSSNSNRLTTKPWSHHHFPVLRQPEPAP